MGALGYVNNVYSDTKLPYDSYIKGYIRPINEGIYNDKAIYLYDRLDLAVRQYKLEDLLSPKVVSHLRGDNDTKLLIFYPDDYFNLHDTKTFNRVLQEKRIPLNKVHMIMKDDLFRRFARSKMGDEITYHVYSPLQTRVRNIDFKHTTSKKFSVFSRNYNEHRLALLLELAQENLLSEFNYTFHNFNPYVLIDRSKPDVKPEDRIKVFTQEEIVDDAKEFNLYNEVTREWIEKIPYTIEKTRRESLNKWTNVIMEALIDADFHIIVESHYDAFNNYKGYEGNTSVEEFSPAFLTEKTYKCIAAGRPFLAYTTPYFIKEIRTLGYKTFHPYINERYDSIEDNDERRRAIIKEIRRLNSLSPEKYKEVRDKCFEIAQHNRKVLYGENIGLLNEYKSGPFGDMLIDFNKYWKTGKNEDYITDLMLSHVQR